MWVQDLNTLKDKLIQVLHSTKQATFCFYIKWFDIDIYLYVQWVVQISASPYGRTDRLKYWCRWIHLQLVLGDIQKLCWQEEVDRWFAKCQLYLIILFSEIVNQRYSPVRNKHAGANKHAWWKIPVNLINMQGLINMYSGSFYQDKTKKNCIGKW